MEIYEKVNLSAPRPEGWGLLKVHPEPRLLSPPLKAGLPAVERVKRYLYENIGHLTATGTPRFVLKTVEIEISKLPFLVYGDRKDLEAKDIKPVTI